MVEAFENLTRRARDLAMTRTANATCTVGAMSARVQFSRPDEAVLDGMVNSREYEIRYRTEDLPPLSVGTTLSIVSGTYSRSFKARESSALLDGLEMRTTLSEA